MRCIGRNYRRNKPNLQIELDYVEACQIADVLDPETTENEGDHEAVDELLETIDRNL